MTNSNELDGVFLILDQVNGESIEVAMNRIEVIRASALGSDVRMIEAAKALGLTEQ